MHPRKSVNKCWRGDVIKGRRLFLSHMRNHTHEGKKKKRFHEQMHAWRTPRLMTNQIIIRKIKAKEKEWGVEYKMFRFTSEIAPKMKFATQCCTGCWNLLGWSGRSWRESSFSSFIIIFARLRSLSIMLLWGICLLSKTLENVKERLANKSEEWFLSAGSTRF